MNRSLLLGGLTLALAVGAPPARAAIEEQHVPEAEVPEPPPQPVLTRPPELVEFVSADYPEELLLAGTGGAVTLLIDIDADGSVSRVQLVTASHPLFAEPAKHAALQFEFTPAEIDNVPAPIRIEYRYVFEAQTPEPDAIAGDPEVGLQELQPVTFSGSVREAGNRKAIAGAVLRIGGRPMAETGADGRFEVRGIPPGEFDVRISSPYHQTYTVREELAEEEALQANYYLVKTSTNPFEAVVRTRKERREVSKVRLERKELEKVPGTFGDPVRVIENLPGMGRTPGGLGGALLVRGERPTATGVYIDGVEIPLLYHFGGLTSIINSEFLESIDFYPGGFGAHYGDATAGIVDVKTRDLDCDLWRASAKADFVDAAAFTCVPAGTWSVGAAARRSYVDALLPTVLDAVASASDDDDGIVTASPVYWDYQAKASATYGDHKVDIFAFGNHDTFKLIQSGSLEDVNFDFGLTLSSHSLLLRHRWQIANNIKLTSAVAPGLSTQEFAQSSSEIDLDVAFGLDVYSVGWREDLEWTVNDWLTVNAGLDHRFGVGKLRMDVPAPTDLIIFPAPTFDFTNTLAFRESLPQYNQGYFVEAVVEPMPGLRVVPGLRFDRWHFEETRDISVLPRLTGRYELREGTTVKAAYGLYEKLPEPGYLVPGIGNPNLLPERAQHFIAGVEHQFTDLISADVQGFYNLRSHIPTPTDAVDYQDGSANIAVWESEGTGRAYGLEVLLRWLATSEGRFYGWVAYTLSRSLQNDNRTDATTGLNSGGGGQDDFAANGAREYPSNFDQTHILTLVGQWTLPWGFEAGFRFRLVSGNPLTPIGKGVVSYDADADIYTVDTANVETNSARMPTFHQLDIRIDKTFTFDLWKLTAYLEVINLYNQSNVEQYQYDYRYRERAAITFLPIIPILGVKGAF